MKSEHAREILDQGYTVIPGVLDAEQVLAARAALEQIFARESEIGRERNWHNNVYKVAYFLPQKHAMFRGLGLNERLVPIIREILGKGCNLSNVNGLTMTPGGETQRLHLDAFESTPGTCVYINALHCLDDFSEANGGTRVVPGSHKKVWPREMITEEVEREAIYLSAKAGSVIAYDGALLHAGSRNGTDQPRRALHLFYHRSWAKPQWDYPRSFTTDVSAQLTTEQKSLFGFFDLPPIYNVATDKVVRPMGLRPS
jgi:ectoine hydroxylase-related dioxygenase (phytanoyl-CoA dioxygenase family)